MAPREAAGPSRRHRESGSRRHHHRKRSRNQTTTEETRRSKGSTQTLSIDALARLNEANAGNGGRRDRERDRERERRREEEEARKERGRERERERERDREQQRRRESRARRVQRDEYREIERIEVERPRKHRKSRKRRVVSGAMVEEGRGRELNGIRGGGSSYESVEKEDLYYRPKPKRKKRLWILGGIIALIIIIIIIVAVVVSKKNGDDTSSKTPGLSSIDPKSIPPGTPSWLNPFQWQDTQDFNLTYTDQTVGDLPIMGLYTSWDDSKAANDRVPALNKPWGPYEKTPARGVNLGGWLSLEPFITPSLFDQGAKSGIIDEWTLSKSLGSKAGSTLEGHYSSFVTEQTFSDIANAGLDHVRIPYSYWAVQVFDDDPYVFRTSWRYLLRGIEWARKYGLRVNLDLHGLPGSQNGWNHSGRQGPIGWMNGTNGALNVQRSLDVHDKLSKFFAQDRYKNIISHYGLANEPRMTFLPVEQVMSWTQKAAASIRKNGVTDAIIVFGDGFMGLDRWRGQPNDNNLALDVHQYVIFNNEQIVYPHAKKIKYACDGWTEQTQESMNTATGFGPTLVAEWSQADTDCTKYLGNVNNGNRWSGTYDVGNETLNALTPKCPTEDRSCDCTTANADPSQYSGTYKQFLLMFAEAQMFSFEKGFGWFYWTWDTEAATQWSYKKGLAAGILPQKAWQRDFQCDTSQIPGFSDLPEAF